MIYVTLASFPVTSPTPYMQLVPFQLNPRVGGFVYILRLYGHFKWSLLKIQQFFPPPQPPLGSIARSYGDLSSWCWIPRLFSLAWCWDRWLPRYPSRFLSTAPHFNVGPCVLPLSPLHATLHLLTSLPLSAYPPLLPV